MTKAVGLNHPPATGATAGTQATQVRQQILGPFLTNPPKVGRIRRSLGYRVAIAAVAIGMALLPLLYLGLILLVAAGVYVHATANATLFQEAASAYKVGLLYVAPIGLGIGLVLFMLKPLFAKPFGVTGRYALRPEDEPLLFEFVWAVSRAVGAPRPVRIDLVMDVNAGASFERGVLSFWNNNLVLIIGMPLLTGLTTQQLAGVLAHEFGHFTQGAGMRLSFLINQINQWLHRSVYERDTWDMWLVEQSKNSGVFNLFFGVLRLAIWATRCILWVFMAAGHGMSCVLLRQMEFDADRYEARVAGSEIFKDTCWRMRVMEVATHLTRAQLQMAWHEQRLADNLPSLIAFNANDLPRPVMEHVRKTVARTQTAWHDTHPADMERMARVAREKAPGVYHQALPSTMLLQAFQERARRMSLSMYRDTLGSSVTQRNLVPIKTLLEEERTRRKEQIAGRRYLQDAFSQGFPLFFAEKSLTPPEDPAAMIATLRETRAQLAGLLPELHGAVTNFEKAGKGIAVLRVLQALRNYNLSVRHITVEGMDMPEPEAIPHRLNALAGDRDVALVVLEHVRTLTYRRIQCALRLLHHPPVFQKIGWGIPLVEEAERALAGPRMISRYYDTFSALREAQITMELYLRADHRGRTVSEVVRQLQRLASELHEGLGQLQAAFSQADYPYLHASGKVTVAQYAIPYIPVPRDLFNLASTSSDSIEKIGYYYVRCLYRVCELAESVERVLGMEPFPDPPDTEPIQDVVRRRRKGRRKGRKGKKVSA